MLKGGTLHPYVAALYSLNSKVQQLFSVVPQGWLRLHYGEVYWVLPVGDARSPTGARVSFPEHSAQERAVHLAALRAALASSAEVQPGHMRASELTCVTNNT